MNKHLIIIIIFASLFGFLNACGMGADARQFPPDAESRVRKNIEEGRGFRFSEGLNSGSGNFDFASSNSLWRASLDTIDFMPLASANYSGGIIITDWYSSDIGSPESVKISIRFLTNEIVSNALDIKVFYKKCASNENCRIIEKSENIKKELTKKILTKAAVYEKETKTKNYKPYKGKITTREDSED